MYWGLGWIGSVTLLFTVMISVFNPYPGPDPGVPRRTTDTSSLEKIRLSLFGARTGDSRVSYGVKPWAMHTVKGLVLLHAEKKGDVETHFLHKDLV